ncbi:hypothetical protein [Rhodalgimonas zhirmunskyi]|uniref:Uncharacterized protein n=1 Tax=Rhodalgimonas zhirmunskyi TaxID=2964767 RepID=A0AAJ1UB46_9RHOB|nr:hypothetical protein [Rhodoalgimonas zhirmunskyi]MDQ2092622.1 hypothetical protein [Rhodoalgimonas zhirmunskyi]
MGDEELFGAVVNEISKGQVDENLLAKARFLAKGDTKDTEFKYIELRVQQLKSDNIQKHINATKDAARIIAPALGRFSWDFAKAVLLGLLIVGLVGAILQAFL